MIQRELLRRVVQPSQIHVVNPRSDSRPGRLQPEVVGHRISHHVVSPHYCHQLILVRCVHAHRAHMALPGTAIEFVSQGLGLGNIQVRDGNLVKIARDRQVARRF